jgi:hypothetical protein
MRISIDLTNDTPQDLKRAIALIEEALANKGAAPQQVQQPPQQAARPVQAQPSSFDRIQQDRFAPRPVQAPPQQRQPSVSSQESYNMLNLLSGRNKK